MHPMLRTLPATAPMEAPSTVFDLNPIRDAASPCSRGIAFLLSLGLTPLFVCALSYGLISPTSKQVVQASLDAARKSVSLLLFEPQPLDAKAPARNLVGPEGPGRESHLAGPNTLDPRLAAHTTLLSKPSDAIDPDELVTAERAERVHLSLNPALPLQIGGNGLARGTGRDSALGNGGLIRPPKAFDFKLVPIRQATVRHQLNPGDEPDSREPVRVRILIDKEGVPSHASVISGPPRLHAKALKAALEWRFEPIEPHGLKAPVPLNLTFHPILERSRGTTRSGTSPMPILQIALSHQAGPGEPITWEPSVVRILIGEDGVPTQAFTVSGPPHLQSKALETALRWRFEPLGKQGLRAPYPYVVTFSDSR